MMTSFGTLKEGEAVRLRCLSRTLTAEIREVRTSTGGETIMVSVVTRDNVPRRELPPGQGVAIYGLDASLWEGVIGGSTDSAATILLQTTSGSGTSSDKGESSSSRFSGENRKDLLHRANLAQQFRKYDEMNLAVKDISLLHLDLTSEELECAVCCYNDLLKENWSVLKVLRSRGAENLAHVPARVVRDFSARIEDTLLKQCEDALGNIETHLLPFSSQENKAVFYKMMGDIALLAFEVKPDDGHAMVNTATKSYELAMSTMSRENISPNDTSFLELILNLSALLHDVVLSKTRACTLAIEAVAAISTETLSLKSKIVLDLINQNLNIWLSNESAEHTQVKDEHGTEIDPLPEVLPDAKPQGLQPLFPEVVGAAVVPHGAHQHHQAQGDLINELQHVAGQAVIPFQALDLPPAEEDVVDENPQAAELEPPPEVVGAAVVPHGAHQHQAQADLINEFQHVAGQAVIPFQALDQPPAEEDAVDENPQAAEFEPLPEVAAAPSAVPHRAPQDGGVDVIIKKVPRPPVLQLEKTPFHYEERAGNSFQGKNFRDKRKAKSAEKGKYG